MKKLKNINLHNLDHSKITKHELRFIKGLGLCGCSCACRYSELVNPDSIYGGATTFDNKEANAASGPVIFAQ